MSLLPLSLDISRSGLLTAVWQRKVVEGAANVRADVVVRKQEVPEPPSPSVQALAQALGKVRDFRPYVVRWGGRKEVANWKGMSLIE